MRDAIVVFAALTAIPWVSSQSLGSCKATNGMAGECISVSACGNAGGSRLVPHVELVESAGDPANLCPGDQTIQCCTYGGCDNSAGQPGQCIPTGACSGASGTSDPANLCPGSQDIQCCTYGGCTSGDVRGQCTPVDACSGKSDPANLCPGDRNIQCCIREDPPTTCGAPNINAASLNLITGFEGFRGSSYRDPGGKPTVGYGHLCNDGDIACSEVSSQYGPFSITEAEGRDLFQNDAKSFKGCVAAAINVPLNDNQYGALVSFTYNLGCGTLQSSTLLSGLNGGQDPNTVAGEELPKFVYADGVKLNGLVRRREAEVKLFQTPSSVGALPPPC